LKKQHVRGWIFWISVVLPLSALLGSFSAFAADPHSPVVKLSYIRDETGTLTVDAVAQRDDFLPTTSNATFGFSQATFWMKVEVDGATLNQGDLYLSVWPPRLENAQLFQVHSGKPATEILEKRKYFEYGNAFFDAFKSTLFKLDNTTPNSIFLIKLSSDFSVLTKVEVLNPAALEKFRTNIAFLVGSMTFGLVPFLIIFLSFAIRNSQPVYVSCGINIFSITVLYLATIGFDFFDLFNISGPLLDHQIGFLVILSPLSTFYFFSHLCELTGAPVKQMHNLRLLIKFLVVLSAGYLIFNKQIFSTIFLFSNIALTVCLTWSVRNHFDRRNSSHWILLIAFAVINIAAINVILTLLGIKQSNEDIIWLRAIRTAFMPMVIFLLITHFEQKNNQALYKLAAEKVAVEKSNALEKQRRQTYENFVTMLLHEIKTPLSIIQLAAASLGRYMLPLTPEVKRVESIQKSVIEINQTFNKCMQAIDVDNNSLNYDPSEFNISVLFDELNRSMESDRVVYNMNQNFTLFTDFVLLKTVLTNLLTNALKYGKEETKVRLDVTLNQANPKEYLFKVTNMPSDVGQPDEDKVFQRFYRAESAKKFSGSGQGLWLAQQLAMAMNSKIELTRSTDLTCFTLYLSQD
jgi:signal transduction histidine kinase